MSPLTNVNIGQYHNSDSPVHRLDPRTKLLALAFIVIAVFFANNLRGSLIIASFLLAVFILSQLPLLPVLRSLWRMLWLFASIIILHALFADENSSIIFSLGPVKATWEGVYGGIMVVCQFILMVVSAGILTLTTAPLRLADGIEAMLHPLRKIGAPVQQLSIMMAIALHFIPVLFIEAEKLISAQMARGAHLEGRNSFKKLRALMPALTPLFISSFRRADELAIGMESRCYQGGNRSHLHELRFSKADGIALISAAIITLSTLLVK